MRSVIVGAGMSGLTAAAYLLRSGHDVLILEKTSRPGGLVNSFEKEGFLFDAGPRAVGNGGILKPMLDDLGLELPLVKGEVSTGMGDRTVHFGSYESSQKAIDGYAQTLLGLFPDSKEDIGRIEKQLRKYTKRAEILNKTANPFFKKIPGDRKYLFTDFIPWLPSFLRVLVMTTFFNNPMEKVLSSLTDNSSLRDMVSQHFFKGTPVSFALGYTANYRDYLYPLGGTGRLPAILADDIRKRGGRLRTETEIVQVVEAEKKLRDRGGREYPYDLLLWTADLKTLYNQLNGPVATGRPGYRQGKEKKYLLAKPGESVFSLFLAVNEPPETFEQISRGHFIYTPVTRGLGDLHRSRLEQLKKRFPRMGKQEILAWLKDFCKYNSYEISLPVLKDKNLAPSGQTGLVVSLLFDGELSRLIEQAGWFDEFRAATADYMVDALDRTVYPGIKDKILFCDSATPLTIEGKFNSSGGAITGWTLEEHPPVPSSLAGISGAVKTGRPRIYKAGQWSYSPSGVPVAILTGRIAAAAMTRVGRRLKDKL